MNSGNTSTSSEEKKEHNSTCSQYVLEDYVWESACSQFLLQDRGYVPALIMMGLKALKSDDKQQLLEFFRLSKWLRAEHYGNLAPKCAELYYIYGSKFLQRARGNSDIGPKKVSESTYNEGNLEQGADDKDQEEYQIKYGDSHLKLALYTLNAAKELIEKQPDTLGKAKIFKALGDVFFTIGLCILKAFGELVARGSFEQSVSYYEKVLSMWPQMVEPDSSSMPRLIIEIFGILKTEHRNAQFISFSEKVTANDPTSNYQFTVAVAESGHYILNMKEEMDLDGKYLQLPKEKYDLIAIPKDNPSIVSDLIAAMAAEEESKGS